MQLRPERIDARLKALKLSARAVSLRVAGTPDLVRHILQGRQRETSGDKVQRLASALRCSVDYLYGNTAGVGEPPGVRADFVMPAIGSTAKRRRTLDQPSRALARTSDAMAEVPEYDIQLSAGGGAVISDETVRRYWGLPRAFLESMSLDAEHIAFVEIVGDSMVPVLMPGDLVLLDLRSRNPGLPAIYALWDGDATVCKRVEKIPGSEPPTLRVISANPAYSTYEVPWEWANVIGRVAWFARRT